MEGNQATPLNVSTDPTSVSQASALTPPPVLKPKSKKSLTAIIGFVIFLLLAGGAAAGYVYKDEIIKIVSKPKEVACTMEAKVCPDGSSVGRTGPKCEFAPCPTVSPQDKLKGETANWKTYANTVYGFSIKFPSSETISKCGGEPTNKIEISEPADGTEESCIFTHNSFISLDFLDMSLADLITISKSDGYKGEKTTISGKPAYIYFSHTTDNRKMKNVNIDNSPKGIITISALYEDSNLMKLFDQAVYTFKFTDKISTQNGEQIGEVFWSIKETDDINPKIVQEIKDAFKAYKPNLPNNESIELTLLLTSKTSSNYAIITAVIKDEKNEIVPSEPFEILLEKSQNIWNITPKASFCETLRKLPEDIMGSRREYYFGCFQ